MGPPRAIFLKEFNHLNIIKKQQNVNSPKRFVAIT